MAVSIGAFIQPLYNTTFTPGPGNVLSDPAMTGIALEIVGGGPTNQQSWTWWPNILHAFYNVKGYCPSAGSNGVPMPTAGVRYIGFDDTPAQNLGANGNKYATGGTLIICLTLPHSFYVGQFVAVSNTTPTINTGGLQGGNVYQVTAINSPLGTGITTLYNLSLAQVTSTNIGTSAQTTGTVAAAAGYSTATSGGYANITPFTNITDTTGLNTNNLGPRRFTDYVLALYNQYSATPPTLLLTLRTGAINSSHNMEKTSSWQQNAGVDEFDPAYILAGHHDNYFKAFFSQLADYMFANQTLTFIIRLDQEMNGASYSWSYNNQYIQPVNSIAPSASPTNGPNLLNTIDHTATSGNPVLAYGVFASMWRYIVALGRTAITNQLQNAHGLSAGAATTLSANLLYHECFGSGSVITPSGSPTNPVPIVSPPYPQIPHTLTAQYTITNVVTGGGNTTLTVNPGTDFTSPTSGTWNLVGHGFWPGAQICPGGTAIGTGSADTLTSITNTTMTFPTGTFNYTIGGTVTLWWGSSAAQTYIQSVGPLSLFYAGDDAVDVPGFDGYNSGKTGGTWKNYMSQSQGSGVYGGAAIFPNAYTALTTITAKSLMITETGSPEGNSVATTGVNAPTTTSKPQWIKTNLGTGGQLLSSMPAVTRLVYFDQVGQGSSYSIRTSSQALTQWQALSSSYTTNGALPINPPITTGLPGRTIILRSNTLANFAAETSKTIGELDIVTDVPMILAGAANATIAPENMAWLPFAPAGALTAGNVLTATGAHAAAFQAPTTAPGSSNGFVAIGSETAGGLIAAQTNVVLTTTALTAGAWYLLVGAMLVAQPTTVNVTDVYFVLGTATLTAGTLTGTTLPKATSAAGTSSGSISAVVQINASGTITLNAFPAGAVNFTAKKSTTAGASVPATWLSWVRIA